MFSRILASRATGFHHSTRNSIRFPASSIPCSNSQRSLVVAVSDHHFSKRYLTTDAVTRDSGLRPYQKNALGFLDKLKENNKQTQKLACLKVEEILLQGLTHDADGVPEDGPMALNLLQAALSYANLPNERLVPRLFSLSCQLMSWNENR